MEKNKVFGILTVVVVIAVLVFLGVKGKAGDYRVYPLEKGKNFVIIGSALTAKQLILENPQIEYISYFDENTNSTIGFVNYMNGIGKNFLLEERMYEIGAKDAFNMSVLN